ncbi:hypothetical protein SALBM311S_03609 [Streptomyces alboniger]
MADRTPDTSVLDQDDPPAQSSGAEQGPGPDLAEEHSGQPSGGPTSKGESAEPPDEPDELDELETPEQTQDPDQPDKPKTPEPPEEPDEPHEPDEPDEQQAPQQTQEPDQPEAAADAPAQEPGEPKNSADASPAQNPDEPQDAAGESGEPAEEADKADADAEDGEAPAQDTEAPADEAPDAEDDATSSDENTDPAPEDSNTSSDKAAETPADDDPEKAATAEASENTRTVALRDPEVEGGIDKTMAISVSDLRRAEPTAAPAAPQESQGAEGTEGTQPAAPSPIDLLAQLTNTPPPRPTSVRTLLRRIKIWSPLVALLALAALVLQLLRPLPEPTVALVASASSFTIGGDTFTMPWPKEGQAAVMVAGSGMVGTFGEQKPVPTASVAKIMTAYVILRGHPLKRDEPGPRVTVDARTVKEGKAKDESRIEGLRVGQKFDLQDMLKMLMIPSGNNVARLLARWDTKTGDETAFVRKMNEAAKSLGMKNTTYTDPSGLDKGTVSTAVDQLKLAEAVMRFESFRSVVAMANADIPGLGRIYNNNDRLIVAGLSVRGIKTGSNTAAGGTLSWAAYRTVGGEDRLILGSMMDQHATGADPNGSTSLLLVQDNSKKVIKAVREALTSATAVKKGQVVGHVDDGLGGRTPVVATKDLKAVGVPGQKLTLTFRDGRRDLAAGTKAGTVVGELSMGGGTGALRVPVALRSELGEPSLGTKLTRTG